CKTQLNPTQSNQKPSRISERPTSDRPESRVINACFSINLDLAIIISFMKPVFRHTRLYF
ncbi:MAG: hypothetical protein K0U33_01650, partial [Bacteroidetes bacterium]|nr:hypothetical protein [Bacteroidota bacterium]